MDLPARAEVIVIGAGHNGLVAAAILARAGLDVLIVEAADTVGGAARTEAPFRSLPQLRQSTGAYLLGLMPPELLQLLDVRLPLLRRDPHYFLPTLSGRRLLFGRDRGAVKAQFVEFFSAADWVADEALNAELAALRHDLAPAWLAEPLTTEETAERYIRPDLRGIFVELCCGSVLDYLERFGFRDELLIAMYAVTDGLSGLAGGIDTPGSGHNFLVHNMCRLPDADGTWMIVRGGMGTVTQTFADVAARAGAVIRTGLTVARIDVTAGSADGVTLADGRSVHADAVLACVDPFRLDSLVRLPAPLRSRVMEFARPGSTLKVNLALSGLPRFSCQRPGDRSPLGATIHLLPEERPLAAVRRVWTDVSQGKLPEFPTIEWYVHTTVDPSLQDPGGHHSAALFVQSVPYQPAGSSWVNEIDGYVEHLLGICDRFAPGTSELVVDTFPLAPPDIERHFGITHGHIHHVDNGVAFADRMPYVTGIDGLYAGGAGCHPAGSVIGAAGHNAAQRILDDLGRTGRGGAGS
ncbi:MAG TPA: NAD(P)/FAD-dependent oxidoreductase [Mycobacteriales bacterium]|nr:NAD(P)/FAD-dependent oxidoreductase [Mycobacteriales bacterium]